MAVKSVYPSKGSNRRKKTTTASGKRTVRRTKSEYKNTRRPVKRSGNPELKKFIRNIFRQRSTAGEVDYTFLLLVSILTIFGLIMLLSVSTPAASVKFKNSYYFFSRQAFFMCLGGILMAVFANIDYRRIKPFVNLFYVICVILLCCVFLPVIGVSLNGARRWINLGFTNFQPSELAKLSIAMLYAKIIEEKQYDLSNTNELFKASKWLIVVVILMMFETHVSGTIVICGIAGCVIIAGGANFWKLLMAGAGLGVVGCFGIKILDPGRWSRIINVFDPFVDTQDTGYQVVQSLYAIGSGGIFGKGLGQSVQKFSYLPEPYNDFIFAIICEELGFLGAGFIIVLFGLMIYRGIQIAINAPDKFGCLTVLGIMAQVGVQTVLNIAVVTSTVPNTGISLPFFSYGGTSLMILLAQMGIVLNVSRYSTKNLS